MIDILLEKKHFIFGKTKVNDRLKVKTTQTLKV